MYHVSVISPGDTREAHNFIGETSTNSLYTWERPTSKYCTKSFHLRSSDVLFHTTQTGSIKSLLLSSWTGDIQGESSGSGGRIGKIEEELIIRTVSEQLSSSRIILETCSLQICYIPPGIISTSVPRIRYYLLLAPSSLCG